MTTRFGSLAQRLPRLLAILLASLLALAALPGGSAAAAVRKHTVMDMDTFFHHGPRLSARTAPSRAAQAETTIYHQVFFTDLEGNNSAWSVTDFKAGQPNAWHLVTGSAHACTGTSWWMGEPGFTYGDGYGNDWVQSLTTAVPINLSGTSSNNLTFQYKVQTEYGYDWCWVLIKGGNTGALYDTLASYSGNFGSTCNNGNVAIPDSFTTVTQPVQLRFLFGSDLTVSTADSNGTFTGWSLDNVKITGKGNNVSFFDDMESGSSKWTTSSPDPGALWHIESAPGTSVPASCFFLSTNVFVPFQGTGFGIVPDFSDQMLISPPMNLTGVFSPNTPTTVLRLQFDDWVNLPFNNAMYWSLWIQGSYDQVTWTPWHNAFGGLEFSGGNIQCTEGAYQDFDPYITSQTGIQPGTPYIRLGFRLRDEKAIDGCNCGGPMQIGIDTEGIYFDNIGVYYIYTISGVETVSNAPYGTRAALRKVYPNPFNPRTTVEFSVPTAGPVAVRIFDIHGKQVATLVDASMAPGVYRVHWDGTDAGGSDVASGVYFAQMQSRSGRDSARLLLLK